MAPKIPFVGKRHMPIAFLLSASAASHRERPVSRDASSRPSLSRGSSPSSPAHLWSDSSTYRFIY